MPTTSLDLERVRADTPGASAVAHFNNAGSALPPAIVVDTVVDYLRREAEIGGYEAAAEAEPALDAVYDSVARLIGGRRDQVAIIENATRAWDMAVYGYPFQPGHRVLIARAEYVSNAMALLQLRKRHGIEVVLIEDDEHGAIDLAQLERELERGAEMVSLTHVPTSGGLVNPAPEVGALCAAYSTFFVLDACQSAGQVPLDVGELRADVVSSTGRKYLRGPRGTGWLWCSDRALDRIEPPFIDLHAADWDGDDGYRVRADARRFENWETYFAGKLGLGAAVDYLLDLGVEVTTTRIASLGSRLRSGLADVDGVTVHDKGAVKAGIVTFSVDGIDPVSVKTGLGAASINTSVSSGDHARYDLAARGLDAVVRASAHYYNTEEEVDRLVATVALL